MLGGVVAAQGITIALLNRCMNNVGARVTSSLMSAATLLCADDFQDIYNLPRPGSKLSTSIDLDPVYETRQGKIAIECSDIKTLSRLAEALDIAAAIDEDRFQHCLNDVFMSRTADEWLPVLEQAEVPAAIVIENLADLQTMPHLQSGLNPGSYTKVNSPWRFR